MDTHFKQIIAASLSLAVQTPHCQGMEQPIELQSDILNFQQKKNLAFQQWFEAMGTQKAQEMKEQTNPQKNQDAILEIHDAYNTPLPAKLEPTTNMINTIRSRDDTKIHMSHSVRNISKRLENEMHEQIQRHEQYKNRREQLFLDMCTYMEAPLFANPNQDWNYPRSDGTVVGNKTYRRNWIKFCEESKTAHLRNLLAIRFLPVMRSKQLEVTYGYWGSSTGVDCILNESQYTDIGKVIKLNYYESLSFHPMYGFEPDDLATTGGLADALATLPQTQWALKEFTLPHVIGLKNLEILLNGIAENKTIKTLHFKGIYGAKSVALIGEMLSKNKSILTLHMQIQNFSDLTSLNEFGKGLESNKCLTTLMLTVYPPDNSSPFLKFPYHKPILNREKDWVDFSGLVLGIEKSKIQRIEVKWVDPSPVPSEVFTLLQQGFRTFPEGRFKNPLIPDYQIPEHGQDHVVFKADNWVS